MIKIALKHFIYDFCIEQLFNGIVRNFVPAKDPEIWMDLEMGATYNFIKAIHKGNFCILVNARPISWIDISAQGEIWDTPRLVISHQKHEDGKLMIQVDVIERDTIYEVAR
jgi:hypothetical protein